MNFLNKLINNFLNNKESKSFQNTLEIPAILKDFVADEVLPELNITPEYFWYKFEGLLDDFSSRNKDLLKVRSDIQQKINEWHIKNKGENFNFKEYKKFLQQIGYLAPRSQNFSIQTKNVDPEIRKIAGPQLVVPVMNARFALNAANARWGSLYDALYGTNIISEDDDAKRSGGYNPIRGDKVISFAKEFLDKTIPLNEGSFDQVTNFSFVNHELSITLENNKNTSLKQNDKYIGYMDKGNGAFGLLFKNNNFCLLYTSPSPRDS